jgi:hypothetical protein
MTGEPCWLCKKPDTPVKLLKRPNAGGKTDHFVFDCPACGYFSSRSHMEGQLGALTPDQRRTLVGAIREFNSLQPRMPLELLEDRQVAAVIRGWKPYER